MLQNPFQGTMYKGAKLGKSQGEESQGKGHKTSGSHSGRGTVPTAVEGLKLPSGALPEEKKQNRKERPEGKLPWRVNCQTAGDW